MQRGGRGRDSGQEEVWWVQFAEVGRSVLKLCQDTNNGLASCLFAWSRAGAQRHPILELNPNHKVGPANTLRLYLSACQPHCHHLSLSFWRKETINIWKVTVFLSIIHWSRQFDILYSSFKTTQHNTRQYQITPTMCLWDNIMYNY